MKSQREVWDEFALLVSDHVKETQVGHYATGEVEPMDLIEAVGRGEFALGCVIKYVSRFKRTENSLDLVKAAHYLSRLWHLNRDEWPEESDS